MIRKQINFPLNTPLTYRIPVLIRVDDFLYKSLARRRAHRACSRRVEFNMVAHRGIIIPFVFIHSF